ncbi:MAG: hypothetical protein NZ699_05070, partial [Roseiflexus sp.]|nr:hypothetical protein [Roseiflexus sp.]
MTLVDGASRLQQGDLVSLIGTEEEIAEAAAFLGEMTDERLELDRSKPDFRRVFVSNPQVGCHLTIHAWLPTSSLPIRSRRCNPSRLCCII